MDIFISYASEDRDVAEPLAAEFRRRGYKVWFDKYSLTVGDSLTDKINDGLSSCRYGVVILSHHFFSKDWPKYEFESLHKMKKDILPVFHNVSYQEVKAFHPDLGDLIAANLNDGIEHAVNALCRAIDRTLVNVIHSYKSPILDIAGVEVPDMPLAELFNKQLLITEVPCSYEAAKPLPQALRDYYESETSERVASLRLKKRKSITNGKGYSLKSITIDKGQLPQGGRYHWPNLVFEPAEYFHQVMFSERLDEPELLHADNETMSIRDFMGIDFSAFSWSDVNQIPIPQRFANVVGLVVPMSKTNRSDKCLIVGIRSDQTFVSEDGNAYWQASMSCAEGMLRPDDANMSETDPPSPFNTASRAIRQELGIADEIYRDNIKMVALGYDSRRCQPVAAFLVETDAVDFDDVFRLWQRAEDRNENREILPIPVNNRELNSLIKSSFSYKGKPLRMFSNHQLFGACVMCEVLGKSNFRLIRR